MAGSTRLLSRSLALASFSFCMQFSHTGRGFLPTPLVQSKLVVKARETDPNKKIYGPAAIEVGKLSLSVSGLAVDSPA